jgi:hypothetical protein
MPNGKPGDHPLTDIVVYQIPTFTPEIDALVREIHALAPSAEGLSQLLAARFTFQQRDSDELQAELLQLREHLLRSENQNTP